MKISRQRFTAVRILHLILTASVKWSLRVFLKPWSVTQFLGSLQQLNHQEPSSTITFLLLYVSFVTDVCVIFVHIILFCHQHTGLPWYLEDYLYEAAADVR